jgi:hypothetical protein
MASSIKSIINAAFISILTLAFAGSTFAMNVTNTTTSFSPYVDLTLNVCGPSQSSDNDTIDLVAISKESGVRNFHLAFITDAGQCVPAWGGDLSKSVSDGWASQLTDNLRTNNIRYTVSFGGENGKDLSKSCSAEQLALIYQQIIKTYQPEGLDFDIENDTVKVPNLISALKKIMNENSGLKISFTLPVLPEGLTTAGKNIVNQLKAANLHFVINIMVMDYSSSCTGDMGKYAIQAAKNSYAFLHTLYPSKTSAELWQMIAFTPLIGVNDTCKEKFTLANADELRRFAQKNKLAYFSMWSMARDNPCSGTTCCPICSGADLQTIPYEFSRHFMKQEK